MGQVHIKCTLFVGGKKGVCWTVQWCNGAEGHWRQGDWQQSKGRCEALDCHCLGQVVLASFAAEWRGYLDSVGWGRMVING